MDDSEGLVHGLYRGDGGAAVIRVDNSIFDLFEESFDQKVQIIWSSHTPVVSLQVGGRYVRVCRV